MDNTKTYSVYVHTNLTNNKKYFGITSRQPEERWGKDGCNYRQTPHFWSAICKYGWDSFSHIILLTNLTREEACNAERALIKEYQTQDNKYGYNILDGGEVTTIPESVRKKMSVSMIGNKNGFGKPCSEEKKKKIGDAQRGRKFTTEHRNRISLAKIGKSHEPPSEETRKKISNSHKKNPVICVETQISYPSIQECARQTGIDASTVCACCKGRIKSVHGLHFVYYPNLEMPNDYPEQEYTQAGGNGGPLTCNDEGEDIV